MSASLLAPLVALVLGLLWLASRRRPFAAGERPAPPPSISRPAGDGGNRPDRLDRDGSPGFPYVDPRACEGEDSSDSHPSAGTVSSRQVAGAELPVGPPPSDHCLPPIFGGLPEEIASPSARQRRLLALWQRGGSERVEAMAAAQRWGHPAALPLLRRGLRDADPRVVLAAARGMERFRGRTSVWSETRPAGGTQPPLGLPRSVSRTR